MHQPTELRQVNWFQTELKADVARGDVDLRLENSSVDTHTNSYGIDEETIIYYYNGSKGYVAVGYDNMAKMIDADKAGGIDNGKVRASVVAFDDATDVAEVIVLYTDQAKFGTDAYVYVMSVYDKSGSVHDLWRHIRAFLSRRVRLSYERC